MSKTELYFPFESFEAIQSDAQRWVMAPVAEFPTPPQAGELLMLTTVNAQNGLTKLARVVTHVARVDLLTEGDKAVFLFSIRPMQAEDRARLAEEAAK